MRPSEEGHILIPRVLSQAASSTIRSGEVQTLAHDPSILAHRSEHPVL